MVDGSQRATLFLSQALDGDEDSSEAGSSLGPTLGVAPSSRRASIGVIGDGSNSALKTRPPGRTSRRVSLIPGEALEQAHAVLDREHQSRRGSATSQSSHFQMKVNNDLHKLSDVIRTSLQQQMQLAAQSQQGSRRGSCKDSSCDLDEDREDFNDRRNAMRRASTYEGDNSVTSPSR